MAGLFTGQEFAGFGPNRLQPWPGGGHRVEARRPAGLRSQVRQLCPRRPGVYGMFNERGELIYIGKAKCLRTRLLSYFRSRSRDPKAGRVLGCTLAIAWEHVASEFGALLRELELIRRWRPRYNVQGQPGRWSRTYVCLGRRPAAYVFLSRRPPSGVIASYGPISAGEQAREAVRRINDCYQLRDCPQAQEMIFSDQLELFGAPRAAGCLRYEIGTCLGPCAALCSRAGYSDRVRAARAFLDGNDGEPLLGLEREMAVASAQLAFERAAALRDKLESLRWLRDQLDRLRRLRDRQSFVYPVAGFEGQDVWYLIHHGRAMSAVSPPRDPQSRQDLLDAFDTVYQEGHCLGAPLATDEIDAALLIASWFRRHPAEECRVLQPQEAIAQVRQGEAARIYPMPRAIHPR